MKRSADKKFGRGLVLGKFMPPHHGHRLVITTALAQAEQVALVVCTQSDDPIKSTQRVEWLTELYPTTQVFVLTLNFDVTNPQQWADHIQKLLGFPPDAVFSSEDYGVKLAALYSCTHVMVDPHRLTVPISASQIRAHPERYQHYLDPRVARALGQA